MVLQWLCCSVSDSIVDVCSAYGLLLPGLCSIVNVLVMTITPILILARGATAVVVSVLGMQLELQVGVVLLNICYCVQSAGARVGHRPKF